MPLIGTGNIRYILFYQIKASFGKNKNKNELVLHDGKWSIKYHVSTKETQRQCYVRNPCTSYNLNLNWIHSWILPLY